MSSSATLDPRQAKVLKALARDPAYAEVLEAYAAARAPGRKGFGSGALKTRGRIFSMVTPRGEFVVKLPQERVKALVAAKRGRHFDAHKGKPMQEWFVATDPQLPLLALVKEAFTFVAGGN